MQKEGVYFVHSSALCEHPLGGNSFAVNTRISYSEDGGVRKGEGKQGERQERERKSMLKESIMCISFWDVLGVLYL